MKTHSELLDELYARVGSEKYEAVRAQVVDLTRERTEALREAREKAFSSFCMAETIFNTRWQEAWYASCNELIEVK